MNEITENTKRFENLNIEHSMINLTEDLSIRLKLEFSSTNRKTYITKETLYLVNQRVDCQLALAKIRAMLKKFYRGKLRTSEESKYFELVQKTEKNITTKSLDYLNTETNQKFRITEVDAEAMIDIWNLAWTGFSRVKLIGANKTFSGNSMFYKLSDDKIFDIKSQVNLEGDPDFLEKAINNLSEDS